MFFHVLFFSWKRWCAVPMALHRTFRRSVLRSQRASLGAKGTSYASRHGGILWNIPGLEYYQLRIRLSTGRPWNCLWLPRSRAWQSCRKKVAKCQDACLDFGQWDWFRKFCSLILPCICFHGREMHLKDISGNTLWARVWKLRTACPAPTSSTASITGHPTPRPIGSQANHPSVHQPGSSWCRPCTSASPGAPGPTRGRASVASTGAFLPPHQWCIPANPSHRWESQGRTKSATRCGLPGLAAGLWRSVHASGAPRAAADGSTCGTVSEEQPLAACGSHPESWETDGTDTGSVGQVGHQ